MSRLLTRPKWTTQTKNLEVGQLVLIQEEGMKTTEWPLAILILLHPGADGKARVATVKTKSGLKKRAIVKLYPLPVDLNPFNDNIPALNKN